jgi:hypothetical protein
MPPARPRVGLLVPRFTVFDGALGAERVDRLRRRRELLARTLEPYADVVASASIEDESDATHARRAFNDARIELVVVAPAMAAPPSLGVAVLVRPSWPALIWNAIGVEALAPDADQPTAMLLSCGLADLAFGLADSASLYEVTGVPGVRGTASGVRYAPRTGPATLIGMSAAADGWRLSWLEGEARGEASRHLRGVAVRFRPSGLDALAAASSWISAGVTHHPVLVPGRVGETLALVARALGARAIAA